MHEIKWWQDMVVAVVHSVVSTLCDPIGLQHARLPCPSPTPRAYSNSCPLSRWCHSTLSSCVIPFSSCPQSFPASRSFPMSQLFASGGQSTGASASASVSPMNIQDWFPLALTLQARILEWVAISSSRGSSQPRDGTCVSCLLCCAGQVLYR